MTTKKIVKQTDSVTNALATFQPSSKAAFDAGLMLASEALSDRAITPAKLTETYELLYIYQKKLGVVLEIAKASMKKLVEEQGQQKEEGLSKSMVMGNYQVDIRPVNTKLDSKKVEALIRAKGIPIDKAMDQEISYKINESKLQELIIRKKMTADELESCRHELKYSLQPPKKIND